MNTPNNEQLSLFGTPEPPLKSSFYDWEIDSCGYENSIQGFGSLEPQDEASKLQANDNTVTKCSDTWISFQESEDSALQQSNLGESRQLSLWRSTPTLNSSCDRTSQEYQFTQISETTTQNLESLKLLPQDFRVPAHQTQELERDSSIQLPLFGEKDLDVLSKLNPASVLSNNLKELSDGDFELFLADSLWQDTLGKLAMCRQQSLGRVIKGSDYLSFPTLTSNAGSTSRPAGQNKCEKWFKDKGLIPSGLQLGTQAIALTMGFPSSWFEELTEQYSNKTSTPSQVKPQVELEPGISQDEQLHQDKQPLPSIESSTSTQLLGGDEKLLEHKSKCSSTGSEVLLGGNEKLLEHKRGERSSLEQKISIPCLVKQPKQPQRRFGSPHVVKGVIRKDEGDRLRVEVDGDEISVSKLFVYPDFSKSVGQIPPTKKVAPPSKNSPTKQRRKKGDGTGYIYRRTVTRKDKQYQESYFRYRDESGKLRSKYIPQKLLSKVEEAESQKKPIADILVLLGGDGINRGEQSSSPNKVPLQTSQTPEKSDEPIPISRGEQITPPSKRRRKQGEGSGWIECKPIKRSGKEYKQYWYHYEEWRSGDRLLKKSKYIPKRLVQKIERMNSEKAAVREILEVFQSKRKK